LVYLKVSKEGTSLALLKVH